MCNIVLSGLMALTSGSAQKASEFQKRLAERDLSLELLPSALQEAVTTLALSAKDGSSASSATK